MLWSLSFAAASLWSVLRFRHFATFLGGHAASRHSDFALYYEFAKIGVLSGYPKLYDPRAQQVAYRAVGGGLKHFALPYTPPVALLGRPFLALSVPKAYVAWEVAISAALLVGCVLLCGRRSPWNTLIALVLSLSLFPVLFAFALGQLVVLQVAAVAVAVVALESDHDLLAGALLAATLLHPQDWFLIPILLVVTQRWRALGSAAVCATLMVAVSALMLGRSGVHEYFDRLNLVQHHPELFAVSRTLTVPLILKSYRSLALAARLATIAATIVVCYRRRGNVRLCAAAASLGSLLVSPFMHLNDLLPLLLVAWFTITVSVDWIDGAFLFVMFIVLSIGSPTVPARWGYAVVILMALWLLSMIRPVQKTASADRAAKSRSQSA